MAISLRDTIELHTLVLRGKQRIVMQTNRPNMEREKERKDKEGGRDCKKQ